MNENNMKLDQLWIC